MNIRGARAGTPGRARRVGAVTGALALAAAVALAGAAPASATTQQVDDATFTWGISGYAQVGIFGPWTYKDLTGNASVLTGSVSGGTQSTYLVDPVPATSFPTSKAGSTPNAVHFVAGTGTADPETGAASLAWDGSYTVNAYPAIYNAPNEIYSDPQLQVAADGSGSLSFEFALGAGTDMSGNPTPAQEFGRLDLVTFSAGSVDVRADGQVRFSPDYQGVAVTVADSAAQTTTCAATGGATGWWGSWSPAFVNAVPASVRPHFYSTGCGGMQDAKPALPVDVTYTVDEVVAPATPQVVVSSTTLQADGTSDITVTGTGFTAAADGTVPGIYVAVGPKSGDTWYLDAAKFQYAKYVRTSGPATETATGAKLQADGTFTVTFQDVAPVYTKGGTTYDAATTPLHVLTFAAQGSTNRSLDTDTPLTFVDADGLPITVVVPEAPQDPGTFSWTIAGGTGAVDLGTATATAAGFSATGALRTVTVTDTRLDVPAWTLTGQVGAFTSAGGQSFGGQSLGWTPALSQNTVGAVAGAAVAPGTGTDAGLAPSRTLVSAAAGHAKGSVAVDAALALLAPADTPAGAYTATLTLTALG